MVNPNFEEQNVPEKPLEGEEQPAVIDTSSKITPSAPLKQKLDFDPNFPNILNLPPEKEEEIEKMLHDDIEDYISDSGEHNKELETYEMMYAGEPNPEFDNDPYPGASNTRSPWGAIATKGKVVRWLQSIFGIEPYCIIEASDAKLSSALEQWFQLLFTKVMRNEEYSAIREYRDVFYSTGKLNTGIAMLSWDRKKEKVYENNVTYTDPQIFINDFPSPQEAGISPEEYQALLMQLQTTGSISLEKVEKFATTYNAPKIENVNRDKFVTIPFDVKRLGLARGYGYEFELTWDDLKRGEAEKRYHNIDRVLNSRGGESKSSVEQERDEQEKKTSGDEPEPKKKIFKAHKLIYKYDIDDDGLAEKLIFTYLHNEKVLIKSEIWDDNLYFIPHYCETRPGRFDGIGVCKKVERLNEQGDTVWNLRNNAARMVCSPTFKGKKDSDFDPTEQEWYPGAMFWLENMDDIEQMVLLNNFPELFNEETLLDKYQQLLTGYTSGHGGRELPGDSNAPGNKTIALIQEGSILINDDISCLRDSVEQVFYCLFKMCAKFLDDDDKYLQRFGLNKQALKIAFDQISLKGISVSHNREARKMEDTQFYQIFGKDPLIVQNVMAYRDMLEGVLNSWGPDKAKLVPSPEQTQQMMMQMQQMQMVAQQGAMAGKEGKSGPIPPPPPPPPPPPGA